MTEVHTIISQNGTTPSDYLFQMISQNGTTIALYFNQTNSFHTPTDIPLTVLTYVSFGLTCFITVLGLFGNSSILAIKIKFGDTRLKGHDLMITVLAIFDLIALIPTALASPCVYTVIGRDIRAITTIGCKLCMSIWESAVVNSCSVVILICIERFIAEWYPLESRYLFPRKIVQRCLLIGATAVILMYCSLCVLYCEVAEGRCLPNFAGNIYSTVLKRLPDTTVYNVLIGVHLVCYLVILIILTPMIIVKLYQQSIIRRQLSKKEREIGHFRISVKLTAVVVVFFMFVALPVAIPIVMGLAGSQLIDRCESFLSLLILAMLINHSANFLVFNIFDVEFRLKAFSMFCLEREAMPISIINTPNQRLEQAETSFTRKEIHNE